MVINYAQGLTTGCVNVGGRDTRVSQNKIT